MHGTLTFEQTMKKYVSKLIFVNIPRSNPSDVHLRGENSELTRLNKICSCMVKKFVNECTHKEIYYLSVLFFVQIQPE